MERLEKLINILKLTPHRQPELVKEASHRILSRSIKFDPQIHVHLTPLIEILIQYCDNDDSAQRSLFNDYLNSIVLTFQHQYYQQIFQVLLNEVTNNGTARVVTAALHRIPYLIDNVRPIDLGCEPQTLLKALIEVSRRSGDESVLKALDSTLKHVMPFLDYHIRKSKEMQLLTNTFIDILLRNLLNESSQTKRLAASSISIICSNSDLILQNTLIKFRTQLDLLIQDDHQQSTERFIGFCLCVREIPQFADQCHEKILDMIVKQIKETNQDKTPLMTTALETLKELLRFRIEYKKIIGITDLLSEKFLINELENETKVIKKDIKIILQSNALACISAIIKQHPSILDNLESIFLFRNHNDIAISNQLINIIGNYIEASWRFPSCIDRSVNCEKIRRLWVELRTILNDEYAHPDTLKSCVVAIRVCANSLLESDHCLHIMEYHDLDHLIQLYLKTNFKPFKIEVLSFFASLNYRTLHYLERCHWSKMKAQTASSYTDNLQDIIVNKVIIASLTDEHQRIRIAATSALINIIPNLYITNLNNGQRNISHKVSEPIVSLANDLANEHLVVLKQADEHINHFDDGDEPIISTELHEKLCIRNDHRFLSSSIIQLFDNPYNEQSQTQIDVTKSQHRVNITINLMYVVGLLKTSIEASLDKGKMAISSIVRALYDVSLVYPVFQYSSSWDCRASEYCDCFTLLNFLLTYLENLTEPDVVVEDLEAYKNFLSLSHQLLYALCHESVSNEYEHQKMKPFHKRQAEIRDGYWSELTLKHPCIADILDVYFTHLTKLLWLCSYIIEERTNPFSHSSKQSPTHQQKVQPSESLVNHGTLTSNRLLFGRVHKKLESSYKGSKKNLNQHDEKFYQILETCLSSMSSLLDFVGMNKSIENVKDVLAHLKVTSTTCNVSSLICARQLLKSLFGVNILALYQLDPNDWFEEESWPSTPTNLMTAFDNPATALHGVYHHLVANPYRIFSNYYSLNCSQITPTSDRGLSILNFESRRALKVRRRIEERVRSLFEFNSNQFISPKIRQISELLKNTITEFTPIVTDCMTQFNTRGFHQYQAEILHFMSYLILLRVNYQKLALAEKLIDSIYRLLDNCGEKVFSNREVGIETFLRNSFTFLTLLSYERGPSKPMFQVARVIQKFDDVRAKLTMSTTDETDVTTHMVPLLRCLVEDLFIYRTKHFQNNFDKPEMRSELKEDKTSIVALNFEMTEQANKDKYELVEAEREIVASKLLDIMNNPRVYDLISILILESRRNPSEIKYKKFSQHLLSVVPTMLSKRLVDLTDYRCIELTRRIIENISPEVFQPVNFIFETLLDAPKPSPSEANQESKQEFQRWMSLVIIAIHILITQVKEEVFLNRLRETMSDESFVEYLLHIAQLCIAEINIQLYYKIDSISDPKIVFLTQQLASYILYLTHMFQSGLFFQLSRTAAEYIRREVQTCSNHNLSYRNLCSWSRDPTNGFSLNYCEKMFYCIRLVYPDLTVFWCNVMMLLNNVDCNRDYWRNLLVYECHHCSGLVESKSLCSSFEEATEIKDETKFKRSSHINRPSSLNLSDISFSDQLRRSFIKKIADSETRDKALNRNIIETSDEHGHLMEREVSIGNSEQCLSPNIELTRRGSLCLVLDFVTISMNDVEHITWLIIHYINDIIRWSHEMPITEFISAVHGNSASSGIFIQAINSGCNNLTSIAFVTRLLWSLEQVHYTQYGSLVVLLVEKLLSCEDLIPYRSLTKNIEDFACLTVKKLLNETNKSLVTTNDEVVNQLTADDLDKIYSMLDKDLYPNLTALIIELREATSIQTEAPTITSNTSERDSDEDSQIDDTEVLYSKINLVYWLSEQNQTAHISTLIPTLNVIKLYLSNSNIVERIDADETLVCFLISAIYSLALNSIPPPTRLTKPKFWLNKDDTKPDLSDKPIQLDKPVIHINSKRAAIKTTIDHKNFLMKSKTDKTQEELVEAMRTACLKVLFLLENIDYLRVTQFEYLTELIIRLTRLPSINSFVLTPPTLWRQNIWPIKFKDEDIYRINFPMVTHDILSKDINHLENFCDRLLKIGWLSRRQFEEAWMTLLGVLSTSLSQPEEAKEGYYVQDLERKTNLLISCKVVSTITKLLALTRRSIMGDPLSLDSYPKQSFDERVIELTKAIASNLSALRKRTLSVFEAIELDKKNNTKSIDSTFSNEIHDTGFSNFLRISAQKLRMNAILNASIDIDMQDTVVIDSEFYTSKSEDVDVESCIRLLLSIYKQKFKDPNENLCPTDDSNTPRNRPKNFPNQLAPPLATAICQSIISLSDMFTDYEQFSWLFETFVQMFRLADRNEDEVQMQYLILGLCKSTAVCCYEIPNELTTIAAINHRDVMFEKCRQSIEKCLKSSFGPLRLNALFGVYYLLEDSINIVASGAWELDHFKQLRHSRLTWILKLMPIILDRENFKLLTKKVQIMRLLELLCEVVTESEMKVNKT